MRISDWSSDVCSSDLVPTGYCAPARSPYGQNRPENHIGRTPRYKPSCSVQDVPFPNHGPEGPVPSGDSSCPSVFPVFLIGLFVGVTSLTHQILLPCYMMTCGVVSMQTPRLIRRRTASPSAGRSLSQPQNGRASGGERVGMYG